MDWSTHHYRALYFPVDATSEDGGPLTYAASIQGPESIAAALRTSVGLTTYLPAYDGYFGHSEKWFTDSTGHADYLLSDGTLRRVTTTSGRTITSYATLGRVDTSYYAAPASLLTATAESSPVATTSWVGSVLTLTPAVHFIGTALVTVTVSDGAAAVSNPFHWTLTNADPVVSTIADQSSVHGQTLGPLTVSASDSDGDTLIYSATIQGPATIAADLKNSVGLRSYASALDNYYGQHEKWFPDSSGHADYLLSDGTLHRVVSVSGRTITGFTLLGTVDVSYYAAPASLLDPLPNGSLEIVANLSWTGNHLTLSPFSASFIGTTRVAINVSDGVTTSTTTFYWHLATSMSTIMRTPQS